MNFWNYLSEDSFLSPVSESEFIESRSLSYWYDSESQLLCTVLYGGYFIICSVKTNPFVYFFCYGQQHSTSYPFSENDTMRLSELNHPQLFLVRGRGEQVDRGIAGGVLDVALVHLHLNIRVAPDIRFRLRISGWKKTILNKNRRLIKLQQNIYQRDCFI